MGNLSQTEDHPMKYTFEDIVLYVKRPGQRRERRKVRAALFPDRVVIDAGGQVIAIPVAFNVESKLFGDMLCCELDPDLMEITPIYRPRAVADPARDPTLLNAQQVVGKRFADASAQLQAGTKRLEDAKAAGTLTEALVAEMKTLGQQVVAIFSTGAGIEEVEVKRVRRIDDCHAHDPFLDVNVFASEGETAVHSFVDSGSKVILILPACARQIGARPTGTHVRITGAQGGTTIQPKVTIGLDFGPQLGRHEEEAMLYPDIQAEFGADLVLNDKVHNFLVSKGVKI